jgi:hypothetical protein
MGEQEEEEINLEGFITKRGITFPRINVSEFEGFINDLQETLNLNKQNLYDILAERYSSN